jgi:hypothetical protein
VAEGGRDRQKRREGGREGGREGEREKRGERGRQDTAEERQIDKQRRAGLVRVRQDSAEVDRGR